MNKEFKILEAILLLTLWVIQPILIEQSCSYATCYTS